MKKDLDRSAMRFALARYISRQEMLDVTFENGDRFLIATETLVSDSGNGAAIKWSRLRISETGDVLEIPSRRAVIEIPWDRIRAIADPDFRAHLKDVSIQHARQIGKRVRVLRRAAGATRGQLAARVGVSPDEIARLESGQATASIDLIERIAAALGKRLRDFAAA